MAYEAKNFDHLLGTDGFSDQLLKNHFTLYQGYVKNTNTLMDERRAMLGEGKAATPGFAELTRRLGWEWNGMRMHELYFENMKKGGAGSAPSEEQAPGLIAEFKAVGALRGIGWTVIAYDPEAKRPFVTWVNEHDVGHLVGSIPLLVMDVFEHAFMLDYGLKRADYIEAFMKAIDWDVVGKRWRAV